MYGSVQLVIPIIRDINKVILFTMKMDRMKTILKENTKKQLTVGILRMTRQEKPGYTCNM